MNRLAQIATDSMAAGATARTCTGAPERLGDAEVGTIIRFGIPGTGMNGFGSNPVTNSVSGKQYVFVTADTTYFVFGLP